MISSTLRSLLMTGLASLALVSAAFADSHAPAAQGDGPPPLPARSGPPELPVKDGPPPLPKLEYYVGINDEKVGPLGRAGLEARVQAGELTRDSLVWTDGMDGWEAASTRADLAGILQSKPTASVPDFDAKSFVVGTWRSTGTIEIPNMGKARLEGEETYAPDGAYSMNAMLYIDKPSPQLGQVMSQIGIQTVRLSTDFNGRYTVIPGAGRSFQVKLDGQLSMRDTHGLGMNTTEVMSETSPVISMDDNAMKGVGTDVVSRRR